MPKIRLETFTDGVIAILITIMVLELTRPAGTSWHALRMSCRRSSCMCSASCTWASTGMSTTRCLRLTTGSTERAVGQSPSPSLAVVGSLHHPVGEREPVPVDPNGRLRDRLARGRDRILLLQTTMVREIGYNPVIARRLRDGREGQDLADPVCAGSVWRSSTGGFRWGCTSACADLAGARPTRRAPRERCSGEAEGIALTHSRGPAGRVEEVALTVVEKRAELAGALARIVVGRDDRVAADLEARHLEALERHTPRSQVGSAPSRSSTSNPIWVDAPTAPRPS